MDRVKCELCPIIEHCPAHKERQRLDYLLYIHQAVSEVDKGDCPLMFLVEQTDKTSCPKK